MSRPALPRHLLVLGLGYAAGFVMRAARARGVRCSATSRRPTHERDGVIVYRLDEDGFDPALLPVIDDADAVLGSVPPSTDTGMPGDPALHWLGHALTASPARWLGYFSSTGVYADRHGGWVDEDSPADATDAAARARLHAEAQWLALAEHLGADAAVLRLAGIYGQGRNDLVRLAEGTARHIVEPGSVFNRIHVEDIATAVLGAWAHSRGRRIHLLADGAPAAPQDVLAHAAHLSGRALPPALTLDQAAASSALRRFYGNRKRVAIAATCAALHWQPRYPDFREGLQAAWEGGDGR